MEFFSVSVYFCKITTGVLNNDAGELTICIKCLLSCLNVHFNQSGEIFIYSLCDVATRWIMRLALDVLAPTKSAVTLWKHSVAKYSMGTSSCSIGVIFVPLLTCSASSLCLISPLTSEFPSLWIGISPQIRFHHNILEDQISQTDAVGLCITSVHHEYHSDSPNHLKRHPFLH